MNKLLILALTVPMLSLPAQAYESQGGYSRQCFKEEYREEYIPGTSSRPGRVRSWVEQVEVPCSNRGHTRQHQDVDDNSCIEGAVIGGLLGGAGGAALSRNEGNLIGIPLGIVGGALIGCQIDGG